MKSRKRLIGPTSDSRPSCTKPLASADLFTLFRLAEDQPVAVLPPRVMSLLPLRIDDRPFANLDDAITWAKTRFHCRTHQLDVGPLVAVVVNVVGDLAEEHALCSEHAVRFPDKRRVEMREVVAVLSGGLQDQAESRVEVFRLVAPLVR